MFVIAMIQDARADDWQGVDEVQVMRSITLVYPSHTNADDGTCWRGWLPKRALHATRCA